MVPTRSPNNAVETAAEVVEERGPAEGNEAQHTAPRTQRRIGAPCALGRVGEVARRDKVAKFTALLHHVTVDRLREVFLALRRDAAIGG